MFAKMNTTLLYFLMGLLALTNALPSGPKETPAPSLEQRVAYHAERPPREEQQQQQQAASVAASSAAVVTGGPGALTITVVNSMSAAVSTSYVHNAGVPGLVAGGTGTGALGPGQTATIVAPRGWAGNVAVNLEKDPETGEKYEMNGDTSLLEGSLMEWGGLGYRVDMDVSYV